MDQKPKAENTQKRFVVMTEEEVEALRKVAASSEELFNHDKFVYAIWSIIAIAKSFFRRFLPPDVLKNVKLETLRRVPTRMIAQDGKETEGDLFYLVDTIDGEGMMLVILLEHKSGSARDVALQTLGYEIDAIKHMALNSEIYKNPEGRLPAPFTVVLAQYDVPQLDDLLYWVKGTREYGPLFRFHFVNLQKDKFDDVAQDDPILFVAMALSRLAYRVKNSRWNDGRYDEIVEIFSHIDDRDPKDLDNLGYYYAVLFKYTSWFMRSTPFRIQKFREKLMTAREILDQGFAQSFLSRYFGDEMPEDYKNLEAKYIDLLHVTAQRDDEVALQKGQIAELNSEKEISTLQNSIVLGISSRFNAIPSSIVQKLYSIRQKPLLSRISDSLQKCAVMEEFEQDFDRLAAEN